MPTPCVKFATAFSFNQFGASTTELEVNGFAHKSARLDELFGCFCGDSSLSVSLSQLYSHVLGGVEVVIPDQACRSPPPNQVRCPCHVPTC